MRLEKYLVIRGLGSRRVIIEKVKNGDISVNGIQVFDERIDVYEDDKILYLGNELKEKELKYFALYKKMGYIIWTLCQGQLKKECELMKPKDDFCIEQESSFLSSIDIFHYCNISYIFLLLFLHLLCFYMYLIQFRLSYDQRKIP